MAQRRTSDGEWTERQHKQRPGLERTSTSLDWAGLDWTGQGQGPPGGCGISGRGEGNEEEEKRTRARFVQAGGLLAPVGRGPDRHDTAQHGPASTRSTYRCPQEQQRACSAAEWASGRECAGTSSGSSPQGFKTQARYLARGAAGRRHDRYRYADSTRTTTYRLQAQQQDLLSVCSVFSRDLADPGGLSCTVCSLRHLARERGVKGLRSGPRCHTMAGGWNASQRREAWRGTASTGAAVLVHGASVREPAASQVPSAAAAGCGCFPGTRQQAV
ncbi:hypothetical protein TgHK011_009401 [Trichoderma gracile]|nr:hypothetical protein TgHK011_009401 [Trichoderma gracile]